VNRTVTSREHDLGVTKIRYEDGKELKHADHRRKQTVCGRHEDSEQKIHGDGVGDEHQEIGTPESSNDPSEEPTGAVL
jgi:hypothetical protein